MPLPWNGSGAPTAARTGGPELRAPVHDQHFGEDRACAAGSGSATRERDDGPSDDQRAFGRAQGRHTPLAADLTGYGRVAHVGHLNIVNPMVGATPFRALSHPIRRGIVERLALGPATVGEATGGFGVLSPDHQAPADPGGDRRRRRAVEGRTHRLSLEPEVLKRGG